jgi:hypothetical protein
LAASATTMLWMLPRFRPARAVAADRRGGSRGIGR